MCIENLKEYEEAEKAVLIALQEEVERKGEMRSKRVLALAEVLKAIEGRLYGTYFNR